MIEEKDNKFLLIMVLKVMKLSDKVFIDMGENCGF